MPYSLAMEPNREPFLVKPGDGKTIRGPVGGPITIKADGAKTGESLFLFENVVMPGEGPPLHVHPEVDESWYVLEGTLRFRLGDRLDEAPEGSFVFAPRTVPHCFQNAGSDPARVVVMFTPAGMEGFFDAFATTPGPVDLETFTALGTPNGMDVIGPPLSVSDPL